MKYIILIFIGTLMTLFSCNKDKVKTSDFNADCPDEISFSTDIQSVISTSCATSGCHNAASNANGYTLETHDQISTNAAIILSVIRHEDGVDAMPLGADKLSEDFIDDFFCWKEQGKQNN